MSRIQLKLALCAVSVLLGVIGVSVGSKIRFDNNKWLPPNNPYQVEQDYVNTVFKSGHSSELIIAINLDESFFSTPIIEAFENVTNELASIEFIETVRSPLEATIIHQIDDTVFTETYQDALNNNRLTLADYQSHFATSDYAGNYLSTDKKTALIILTIKEPVNENTYMRKKGVIESVSTILHPHPLFSDYFFAGDAYLEYHMDHAAQNNLAYLLAFALIALLVSLYVFFRSFLRVCIVIIPMIISVIQMMGWIIILDHPFTVINIILPILILVIAIADSIHILNRWEYLMVNHPNRAPSQWDMIKTTFQKTWFPCFITSLTTAIGFGSFSTSEILPLKQFGIESLISITSAYILIMIVTLALIWVSSHHLKDDIVIQSDSGKQHPLLGLFYRLINGYPKQILSTTVAMTILFGIGFIFIYTETNFLDVFYKKSSTMQKQFEYIDDHLAGTGHLDIILKRTPDDFKSMDTFNPIQSISEQLHQNSYVRKNQSYLNPVRMIHPILSDSNDSYPTSSDALDQELLFLEFSRSDKKNDVLSEYINFNYSSARIHLQTNNLGSVEINNVLQSIHDVFKQFPSFTPIITGQHMLSHVLGQYVLQTQVKTILITYLLLWILFIGLFGFKIGTIGMIPNIIPIVAILGLISYLHIPFDFATVLIASIAVCLCIDDSIHFLHCYQHSKKQRHPTPIKHTMTIIGRPLYITSVILFIGFAVFCASSLVILVKLGVFTSIAVILAYLSNIVILSAALNLWDAKHYKKILNNIEK